MSKFRRFSYDRTRKRLITRLMARDGENCMICGGKLDRRIADSDDPMCITLDHIVPQSKGGTTVFNNLRLAHKRCNNEEEADRG